MKDRLKVTLVVVLVLLVISGGLLFYLNKEKGLDKIDWERVEKVKTANAESIELKEVENKITLNKSSLVVDTPYTITQRGWFEMDIENKENLGLTKLILLTDSEDYSFKRPEIYNPQSIEYQRSYTCKDAQVNKNTFTCYYPNGSIEFEHTFESSEGDSYLWIDSYEREWQPLSEFEVRYLGNELSRENTGMSKEYSTTIDLTNVKSNKIRIYIDLARNVGSFSGIKEIHEEYWILLEPQAYSKQDVFDNGYYIDPFVDTSGDDMNYDYLEENLVIAYNFDEDSGDVIELKDGIYNGTVSGVLQGNTSQYITGKSIFNTADDNDEVEVANIAGVMGNNFTVITWVYYIAVGDLTAPRIWDNDDAINDVFIWEADNTVYWWYKNGDNIISNESLTFGSWQMVTTICRDGGNAELYFNKTQVAKATSSSCTWISNVLSIGNAVDSGGRSWGGNMENFMFFNKSFNQSELIDFYDNQIMYNASSAGGADVTPPSVDIIIPSNTTYLTSSMNFEINATDGTDVEACFYSLESWDVNVSMSESDTNWSAKNTSLGGGSYRMNVFCNDTAGNENNTEYLDFTTISLDDYAYAYLLFFNYSGDSTLQDFPMIVNGSEGLNLNGSVQYIWGKADINGTGYIYYNNYDDYIYVDSTGLSQLEMEVADGNMTSTANNESIWESNGVVMAIHGEKDYNESVGLTSWYDIIDGGNWSSDANNSVIGKSLQSVHGNSRLQYNSSSFDFSGIDEYSVAFWFYRLVGEDTSPRLITQSYEIDSFDIFLGESGEIYANGGDWDSYLTYDAGFSFGTWYHVVTTRNTTSHRIYVDGELGNESVGSFTVASEDMIILAGCGGEDVCYRHFNGSFDEIYVFNRSISFDEVTALYEMGSVGTLNESEVPEEPSAPVFFALNTTLLYPTPFQNLSDTNVFFNCTGGADLGLSNMSLWINDEINYTIDSGFIEPPIAYFKLNEDTDSVAINDVVNGQNGTLTEYSQNISTTGKLSKALEFDGESQYVIGRNISSLLNTENITITGWFKWKGNNAEGDGAQTIFTIGDYYSSTGTFGINYNPSNDRLGMSVKQCYDWATEIVTEGEWVFFTLVYIKDNYAKACANGVCNWGSLGCNNVDIPLGNSNVSIGTNGNYGDNLFNGTIDDLRIYDYGLSDNEIKRIYSEGNGVEGAEIGYIDTNMSLEEGNYNYSCSVTDIGNSSMSDFQYFSVDVSSPLVNLTYPSNTTYTDVMLTSYDGTKNITFTWDITELSPDTCLLWNGTTNISVTCEDENYTTTLDYGSPTLIFYANDTLGNSNSSQVIPTFQYALVHKENTGNFTGISSDTKEFSFNLEYNDTTIDSADFDFYLNYSGVPYEITPTGAGLDLWYYQNITLNSSGMNEFEYIIDLDLDGVEPLFFIPSNISTEEANYYYGNITGISFGICNDTLTIPYINFTFYDQKTDERINGSISSSTFTYYYGEGGQNQSYSYANTSVTNREYVFCFSPPYLNISIDYEMNYYSTGYPQKSTNPSTVVFTNDTTNVSLYLLSDTSGNYVTFQVINIAEQPLEDVLVEATADLGGGDTEIGTEYTDAAGAVTFWVDSDYLHEFNFSKTGYNDYSVSIYPTQTSYTITLSSVTSYNISNYGQGITYSIQPTSTYLLNQTTYAFNFTISSTHWTLDEYGFNITNLSGDVLVSTSGSTGTGGILNTNLNTGNNTILFMEYYWDIDGNITTGTRTWDIFDESYESWSIHNLVEDFTSYTSSGIFGLTNFGISILAFFIIFIITGILSYKYGFTSPAAISGVIFGLVFFFNVSLNWFTLPSDYDAVSYLPTLIMAIIFVSAIFREVTR